MLSLVQSLLLGLGLAMVLLALVRYLRRTGNWHALWQVWVGQLKDLNMSEFRFFRSGVALLFVGILVRIVNLTLNG